MRILRARDYRRMRWKNGGGETTEIVVSPHGAGLDNFDWRVSMAHVAADGPFSSFAGIDRTLAVLDGNGIRLRVDGGGDITLTTASQPFAFPADRPAGADLIAGPITDLNVMSRRGMVRHELKRLAIRGPHRLDGGGDTMLVVVRGGACTIDHETIGDGDSLLLDPGDHNLTLTPAAPLTLYIADFRLA